MDADDLAFQTMAKTIRAMDKNKGALSFYLIGYCQLINNFYQEGGRLTAAIASDLSNALREGFKHFGGHDINNDSRIVPALKHLAQNA